MQQRAEYSCPDFSPTKCEVVLSKLKGMAAPRLCLHFDVNETIMVGDPAGGDNFEDCINKMLAKNAYVRSRRPEDSGGGGRWDEWVWHDGSPLDPLVRGSAASPRLLPDGEFDRPEGCMSFYKVSALKKPFAKGFTDDGSPGSIYVAEAKRLRELLRWPEGVPVDERLCHDGYHMFLPAFFCTLFELTRRDWSFSLVNTPPSPRPP